LRGDRFAVDCGPRGEHDFFGTYEVLSDRVVEYDLTRYLRETVPGNWQPTTGAWESRKESMLNFLGKVEPLTFKPALQIDPAGGKLLVEALSGRWSYARKTGATSAISGFTWPAHFL
jgi:hypothetical protein